MTAQNSSKHAAHQKAYEDRKRAGLEVMATAWQGLTTAKVQAAAKTAFKVVTWHYRSAGAAGADTFRGHLVDAFAALLERDAGNPQAADWVDSCMADMPSTWTAQYPAYASPQAGEPSSSCADVSSASTEVSS